MLLGALVRLLLEIYGVVKIGRIILMAVTLQLQFHTANCHVLLFKTHK